MHWATKINYKEVSREVATHLIIGTGPAADDPSAWDIGVIAASTDEFTAHRIAREINKVEEASVCVVLNDENVVDTVHKMVSRIG